MRWLPQALGGLYSFTHLELDGYPLLKVENPLIKIIGFSRPSRKLVLLQIPILDLRLSFAQSLNKIDIDKALSRFDLYTRRGGG